MCSVGFDELSTRIRTMRPARSRPRLVMRLGDRLGFRRSTLPQVHGGRDQHRNCEKLALPVLERLEPKLRGAEVLPEGHSLAAVSQFVCAVLFGAASRMRRN